MPVCVYCEHHTLTKRTTSGHGCTREAPISIIDGRPVPFDCHDERFNEYRSLPSASGKEPALACGYEGRFWKVRRPI